MTPKPKRSLLQQAYDLPGSYNWRARLKQEQPELYRQLVEMGVAKYGTPRTLTASNEQLLTMLRGIPELVNYLPNSEAELGRALRGWANAKAKADNPKKA